MISLSESLLATCGGIFESYEYCIDNVTKFKDAYEKLKTMDASDYKQCILNIVGGRFKGDDKDKFEKLLNDAVNAWVESLGHNPLDVPFAFDFTGNVPKIKLRRSVANALGLNETGIAGVQIGDGSLKLGESISTSSQERATCILWNRMCSTPGLDLKELSEVDVKKIIENELLDDNGNKIAVPNDWARSCVKQCTAISNYIEHILHKNPTDYIASRFNEGKNTGDFAKLYAKMVDGYKSQFREALGRQEKGTSDVGKSKDTYDPSDIILIQRGEENELATLANGAKSNTYQVTYAAYKKLFLAGKIFGVSLKKISGKPKFEIFNISDEVNIKTTKLTAQLYKAAARNKLKGEWGGVQVDCDGTYKFSGMSDPEDYDADAGDVKKAIIKARSFDGGNNIQMEIMSGDGPSLGKVPVDVWRAKFNMTNKFTMDNLKQIEQKFQNNTKAADEFIQAGIKAGPWCLPFILIH